MGHVPWQSCATWMKFRPAAGAYPYPYQWSNQVGCNLQTYDFTTTRDVICEGGGDDQAAAGKGGAISQPPDDSGSKPPPVCMRVLCCQTNKSLMITLAPFLSVTNRLPCDLKYLCFYGVGSRESKEEGELLSGDTCKLANMNLGYQPKICLRVGDMRWSAAKPIFSSMEPTTMDIYNNVTGEIGAVLTMFVRANSDNGTLEVHVYSKCILRDRTGGLGLSIWSLRNKNANAGRGGGDLVRSTFRTASGPGATPIIRPSVSLDDKKRRRAAIRAAAKLAATFSKKLKPYISPADIFTKEAVNREKLAQARERTRSLFVHSETERRSRHAGNKDGTDELGDDNDDTGTGSLTSSSSSSSMRPGLPGSPRPMAKEDTLSEELHMLLESVTDVHQLGFAVTDVPNDTNGGRGSSVLADDDDDDDDEGGVDEHGKPLSSKYSRGDDSDNDSRLTISDDDSDDEDEDESEDDDDDDYEDSEEFSCRTGTDTSMEVARGEGAGAGEKRGDDEDEYAEFLVRDDENELFPSASGRGGGGGSGPGPVTMTKSPRPKGVSSLRRRSRGGSLPTVSVVGLHIDSQRTYQVARADVGDSVYTDRPLRWTHLPPQLRRQLYIRTPCDDKLIRSKQLMRFSVNRPALVLVLVDMRSAVCPPKWLEEDGFRAVSDQAIARTVQHGALQETFYGIYGQVRSDCDSDQYT